jgi:hypothetical protein
LSDHPAIAGQADAGTLIGGFWSGAVTQYTAFLPLVMKD